MPPNVEVAEQYDDLRQERDAAALGMWVFLGTEILFFGALFASYVVSRYHFPAAFAQASREHTEILWGTIETGVLLSSSFTMALAVHAARAGAAGRIVIWLLATMALGGAFIGIHGYEYYKHFQEHLIPGIRFDYQGPFADSIQLFFFLYYVMTGFHVLHVTIGVVEMGVIAAMAAHGRFSDRYYTPVELSGLYWHFVDLVWLFLYPLFYLVGSRA